MLLGFKRRFEPYVLDGSKRHSIRAFRKRYFRAGDICDCYGDVRQTSMHLLGRFPCVRVEIISIFHRGDGSLAVYIGGQELTASEKDLLAWRDGFRSNGSEARPCGCFAEMTDFWLEEHGVRPHRYAPRSLDFQGQIIYWSRLDLDR
jgi:hypothetical protein